MSRLEPRDDGFSAEPSRRLDKASYRASMSFLTSAGRLDTNSVSFLRYPRVMSETHVDSFASS